MATLVTIVNPVPGTLLVLNEYLWNECINVCMKWHLIFIQ